MTSYEYVRIDQEIKAFAVQHFEKPLVCRKADQIRFYSEELCLKIAEYETRFNYVPAWAYTLLEQYNARLNSWQNVTYH